MSMTFQSKLRLPDWKERLHRTEGQDGARDGDRQRKAFLSTVNSTPLLQCKHVEKENALIRGEIEGFACFVFFVCLFCFVVSFIN